MSEQPYYKLQIYLDPVLVDPETREKYIAQITKRQEQVKNCFEQNNRQYYQLFVPHFLLYVNFLLHCVAAQGILLLS